MTTNLCPNCGEQNRSSARFCSSCGEPLISDVPDSLKETTEKVGLQSGTILQDRYRIENELGRGGFGAVYRAWDSRLNKACAVKENFEVSPEAQRQFSREATVLASLTHPNLPRVTDHFSIEGTGQYLVMDFVEGEDLASLLHREGKLPVDKTLEWTRQVADALIYLHSRKPPVVHRDIKPANIRITPDDRAVLVDFGLVKLYDPNLRTTIGARAITPGYAPPEQYGRGGSTDVRTDIYALGATLYNLLTGNEPLESVQRMAGEKMLPAHVINPQVDPQISQAIERAMALDPDNRFQRATQFKAMLVEPVATMVVEPIRAPQMSADVAAGVAPQRGTAAGRVPSTPVPKKKTGRTIALIGLLMFVMCLGAAGIIGWWALDNNEQSNIESTQRAISVNQTATAFANIIAMRTASENQRLLTVTAEAASIAQTATAEVATAQAALLEQTATAEAVQTVQSFQVPLNEAKQWTVVINEFFFDNANDWATGERDGNYAKINWTLGDGVYRWETIAHDGFVWWVYPEIEPSSDFYLAADIMQIDGPPDSEMGLMFRHTDDGTYYTFEIDGQQDFAVFYQDGSDWNTIWEWTESTAIIPDGINRLAVIAQGEHMIFYINDQFVAEVFGSYTNSGTAGLLVGLGEAGQEGIWEFYNFEYRVP